VPPPDALPSPAMGHVQELPLLSRREHDILLLTADGRSAPDIARHLGLSVATVKTAMLGFYGKLGVSNRTAAVAVARETGLLE
jgi:two-component system nitrate/nitrite response regulator NarL